MSAAQRGLSWSGRWHIIESGADSVRSGGRRKSRALCGSVVENVDDPNLLPSHLAAICAGAKKSAGECKLCARSAGVAIVADNDKEAIKRVRALADKWAAATSIGDGQSNIVAKAFADELYKALDADR